MKHSGKRRSSHSQLGRTMLAMAAAAKQRTNALCDHPHSWMGIRSGPSVILASVVHESSPCYAARKTNGDATETRLRRATVRSKASSAQHSQRRPLPVPTS
jgi:hypothetical protein